MPGLLVQDSTTVGHTESNVSVSSVLNVAFTDHTQMSNNVDGSSSEHIIIRIGESAKVQRRSSHLYESQEGQNSNEASKRNVIKS